MANEILVFDALASGPGGEDSGSPLNIGPGTPYLLREFSAPAPQQTIQYAGSVDTEGALPAGRKHENRVISLKIMCQTAAALRTLQGKIGKVAREGGTLKWILPNAEVIYFDLHSADTFDPGFDITWHRNTGTYCDVQISVTAQPYGRGPSITLSAHPETTLPVLIWTETGIKGDMPALGDILIDTVLSVQHTLIWGLESRYYNSSATTALFYEAEAVALGGASTRVAGPAGASGAGNNVTRSAALGTSWVDVVDLQTASSGLFQHVGAFRLIARIQLPVTNTGTISLRARWGPGTSASWTTNDAVTIDPSYEGSWRLVDLGQINIPDTPSSLRFAGAIPPWTGMIQALSTVASGSVDVDCIMFIPVLEGSGQAYWDYGPAAGVNLRLRHDGVFDNGTGNWRRAPDYEGDYLRIPPAGAEARTVRIIAKTSRGALLTGADSAIDDLTATLTYSPRYLVVPSP